MAEVISVVEVAEVIKVVRVVEVIMVVSWSGSSQEEKKVTPLQDHAVSCW